jgi:hypothetical protein
MFSKKYAKDWRTWASEYLYVVGILKAALLAPNLPFYTTLSNGFQA